MNDLKIESMKVFYDNHNKKFLKALVVTSDGKKEVLESSAKIEKRITELAKQEGVKKVAELPASVFECAFKYKDGKENPIAADWAKKAITDSNINLNKTSPYNGKSAENLEEEKKSGTKKTIFAAGVIIGAVILTATGCSMLKRNKNKENSELETSIQTEITEKTKKEAPKSWEEYVNSYDDSFAKEFFKNKTEFAESTIRTKKVGDKEVTYMITPKQADMLSIYYDCGYYSNEELLSILGDYELTGNINPENDINNIVNSALSTIIANLCLVEEESDFITPTFQDEKVNELVKNYNKLWLEFMKAEKKADKKKVVEKFEEAFREDFIDAKDGVINPQEHPSAHFILNTYPAALTMMGYPLDDGLTKILVGTEANIDVKEVKTTPESRGLVDDACNVIDRRLENFEDWRYQLMIEDSIIDRENERGLLQDPNFIVLPSKYDDLTFYTYEYDSHDEHIGVMVPLRDAYIKKNHPELEDIKLSDVEDAIHQATVEKIQNQQLNNTKPFHPVENPTGGEKGDVYEEVIEERVEVPNPEQNLTVEEKQEAMEEVVLPEGVMTEEEVQKDIEETQKEVENLQNVYDDIKNHFKSGGSESNVSEGWKQHPLYDQAKGAGTEASKAGTVIVPENNYTIIDENGKEVNVGEHDNNPNQQQATEEVAQPAPAPTPAPEPVPEVVVPTPEVKPEVDSTTNENANTNTSTVTGSTTTTTEGIPEDKTHADNPNQNGQNTTSTVTSSTQYEYTDGMEDVIPGTITTDSEGVWTPGDEVDLSAVYETLATFAVEEMANQPAEEMQEGYQKSK